MARLFSLKPVIAASILCLILLGMASVFRSSHISNLHYRIRMSQAVLPKVKTCVLDMPEGQGPRVELPSIDDVANFLSFPNFTRQAFAAMVAPGYRLRAKNLRTAVSSELTDYWLGRRNLESYDVEECAGICDSMPGCKAFNLYYQRSPTMAPSQDKSCPNPPSMTNIFCSLYSTSIKPGDMSWEGEKRGQFQIVITGSNVFNKETSTSPKSEWLPEVTLSPTSV